MIHDRKYIVFSDEHYNPLGIIRSLGETGIDPIFIVIRGKRLASLSKYVKTCHVVDTIEQGYDLLIRKYGKEENKPFLFTADDTKTSYLDGHYEDIKNRFITYNAREADRITYYMDKDNIIKLAQKHGLKVLPTVKVEKGVIPNDIEYPVITKAVSSTMYGWKKDVFICNSADELSEAYKKIQSKTVLIQKYLRKKNELCIDGFSINHGQDIFYSIASSYNYILPDTYSSYMTIRNFSDSLLEQKINSVFEEIGFEGIFSIEFLVDKDDNLYFCEINFRNSGWSYASTCVGMNLPVLWAESMLKEKIVGEYKAIPEGYTAVNEVGDFSSRVVHNKMGIIKWIKEVKKADCKFYVGKKGDCLPIAVVVGRLFLAIISKPFRVFLKLMGFETSKH